MRRLIEEAKARGEAAAYTEWQAWPQGFYAEAFINPSQIVPLPSWSHAELRSWDARAEEDYYQSVGPTLKLQLKRHAGVEELRKSMCFGLRQILRSDSTIRSKTVNWQFVDLPEPLSPKLLDDMLRSVWNGMRRSTSPRLE